MRFPLPLLACIVAAALPFRVAAAVRCAGIFSDHMVLQRDREVPVWGDAGPGERVTVTFAGVSFSTRAGGDGHWRVRMKPLPASAESRPLVVTGENSVTFTDVLVGEVWFCSGQSNMEKQVGPRKGHPQATDNWETEVKNADYPPLRLYQVPHHGEPEKDVVGLTWVRCSPETIIRTEFSAVGYFFGRELLRELGVPIGLIHSSFGASQIEAWMPEAAFTRYETIKPLRHVTYPRWDRGMGPTELYESMVKPYVPYALRGFLWYQGEANCIQADDAIYAEKMRALVESWRDVWGDPDAPWYYVQIAPYRYSSIKSYGKLVTPEELPVFWDAQARALAIPHTGMVVTTDLAGDRKNIHPTNKRDVGVRLARLALSETYGRGFLARSPRFVSMRTLEDGRVELTFADAGGGLAARDGQPLREFTVAGDDRRFVPAHAEIRGDTVVVASPDVPHPVAVRFAWRELADPNLVNSAGLPAMPFRTDAWPIVRERPLPPKDAQKPPSAGGK